MNDVVSVGGGSVSGPRDGVGKLDIKAVSRFVVVGHI